MVRLLGVAALATGLIFVSIPARAVDWPVFGFDPARTSFNSSETMLTTGNVHGLRMQWQTSLGSAADSAPIYLESVRVKRAHIPMLFITTGSGVTLGIEATTGKLIWKYATHGPNYTHSMPAADPSGTAIYAPGLDGKVHKLHAATGREMSAPGFPALITRIPNTEANESSLNVANGYLYATISGYNGDGTPYDGHVVAVNLSTGKKTVFNSLCSNKTGLLNGGSVFAAALGNLGPRGRRHRPIFLDERPRLRRHGQRSVRRQYERRRKLRGLGALVARRFIAALRQLYAFRLSAASKRRRRPGKHVAGDASRTAVQSDAVDAGPRR